MTLDEQWVPAALVQSRHVGALDVGGWGHERASQTAQSATTLVGRAQGPVTQSTVRHLAQGERLRGHALVQVVLERSVVETGQLLGMLQRGGRRFLLKLSQYVCLSCHDAKQLRYICPCCINMQPAPFGC